MVQQKLSQLLAQVVGTGWKIVWGPVVWKKNPNDAATPPDNAWYVARNPTMKFPDGSVRDVYTVAIAGIADFYDLYREDLGVSSVVDFSKWVATGLLTPLVKAQPVVAMGTYVAFGIATAVYTLLSQAPPPGAANLGVSLYQYMRDLHITDKGLSTIIFTGHSFGGVLSPTLTLGLVLAGILPGRTMNVLAYPTAGPSPGNVHFAGQFGAAFINQGKLLSAYQTWNCNVVNRLDVVPRAWCDDPLMSPAQNLTNIHHIHGTLEGETAAFVDDAVRAMKFEANWSGITYMPIQSRYFTGSPPTTTPKSQLAFVGDVREQHVPQYEDLFGMHQPLLLAKGDSEKATGEEHRAMIRGAPDMVEADSAAC